MKQYLYVFCVCLISLTACKQGKNQQEKTKPDTTTTANNNLTSQNSPTNDTSDKTTQSLPNGPLKTPDNPYKDASFETKIIDGKEGTFGYEIAVTLNGKTQRIRQEHRPSVPGIRGFDTKEDAQKVVDFVVNRIKTKGFPPTVTPDELKKLGVLK